MDFFEKISQTLIGFNHWDAIEIIVLFLIFYGVMRFLKAAHATRAAIYILILSIILIAVRILGGYLPVLMQIYDFLVIGAIVIFCLAFVTEIRRGVLRMISIRNAAEHYTTTGEFSDEELADTIEEIIKAVQTFSKNNIGALIVLVTNFIPQQIIDSGVKLNSHVSAALLQSIFNTKAPLHDGAVLIKGGRLLAAACLLPLTQDATLPQELGTRHRAAIGVSEAFDVLTIIVSEETGVISTAQGGNLERYLDTQMLTEKLTQFYGLSAVDRAIPKKRRRK